MRRLARAGRVQAYSQVDYCEKEFRMPSPNPFLVIIVVVVAVIGAIGAGRKLANCLWYIVAPIIFVIALVLLYNWFVAK